MSSGALGQDLQPSPVPDASYPMPASLQASGGGSALPHPRSTLGALPPKGCSLLRPASSWKAQTQDRRPVVVPRGGDQKAGIEGHSSEPDGQPGSLCICFHCHI